MDSTPKELWPYDDAFEMTKREEEVRDYYLACYMHEAVTVSLANAFRGKGSAPVDWRKKTIQEEIREQTGTLTEDEKQARINTLFTNLELMQKRFEANNK